MLLRKRIFLCNDKEILASLVEFVSQETAGETPFVNNEDQCKESFSHALAVKEEHVEVETYEEKSPRKLDYVMELSDRLARIEEGVAMANYRGARNEILLFCMKAAMPPEKREMADQMLAAVAEVKPHAHFPPTSMVDITAVPSLDQETYQTAVVAEKGPVPRLGTSSGAFTDEIDTTMKGKATLETSQTLKSKGKDCSQPEDSDDDVVNIEPPAKLMGSAIAAHARGRRSGNKRTSQNWQGEDTISSQGCQLLRHFEFGAEDSLRSLSRETNELPRNAQRVSSQDVTPNAGPVCHLFWLGLLGMSGVPTASCENYRLHFRPRADMGLDVEATWLAVYIYAIGRHDIHDLTRDDLLSLRPRLTPSAVVVNTLTLIASRNARRRTNATCWFLPSTFAADIFRGIVWDNIHHIYQRF
ncbi:hypothetical protein PIB30_029499 [Stylosanthes scabra]|uniref:Uncharacterized protein n=1 Tax=Stylosanthes scabra TaxID=79078 RepID=A0ABU6SCU3_9FABA|nr:hypothetical protein [Stylosanthes scabra]